VPLIVDGQEGLLHEILHLVGQAGQTPPEERTHVRAHVLQERMVGSGVTGEPADQQGFEVILACTHILFSYSLRVGGWLHAASVFIPAAKFGAHV
jgi:hypothetical protein